MTDTLPTAAEYEALAERYEAKSIASRHEADEHELALIARVLRSVTKKRTGPRWRIGYPKKPWCDEWFIAITTYGDRVVLRSLPEDFSYEFKTADLTYIKKERFAKWMQFPDSEFIAPPAPSQEKSADRARLDWIEAHTEVEISCGSLGDEEISWSVHSVHGGYNDREWTLLGNGGSVRHALDSAIRAAALPLTRGSI
jgi:hypothetical protein